MKVKVTVIVITLAVLSLTLDLLVLRNARVRSTKENDSRNILQIYDRVTLAAYDGTSSDKPTLIALDGYVYDVSLGRNDFYAPGKPYHDLAGKDSSTLLHMAGANIIKRKYRIVGKYLE